MKRTVIFFYLIASVALTTITQVCKGNGTTSGASNCAADTSDFSPNSQEGWAVLSSYLKSIGSDSVELEIILTRVGTMAGNQTKLFGTLSSQYRPAQTQLIIYTLLNETVWQVTISSNGQCYLKEILGKPAKTTDLPNHPEILPLRIRYKK